MKVVEVRESMEQCNEAGWCAYDFFLEKRLTEDDIFKFEPIGKLLYLPMMRAPFFKIDGDYFHIKGIRGNNQFRVAVHRDSISFLEKVKAISEK